MRKQEIEEGTESKGIICGSRPSQKEVDNHERTHVPSGIGANISYLEEQKVQAMKKTRKKRKEHRRFHGITCI